MGCSRKPVDPFEGHQGWLNWRYEAWTSGTARFTLCSLSIWTSPHGIGHVLQGRGVFSDLTVRDNLLLARFGSGPVGFADRLAAVLDFFPMLKSKIRQKGGELSGGQQQILAIGRALITAPKVLLMDEPSLGLAPVVFDQLRTIIPDIRRTWKMSVLMSEQNVQLALDVADRVYVLERGKVVHKGSADISVLGEELLRRYLGGRLVAPSAPSA